MIMSEVMSAAPVDVSTLPDYVDVVCMREVDWGPKPSLIRRYAVGERLTIPKTRFTDWNKTEITKGFRTRGSFVLYSEWVKGQDASANNNVPRSSEDVAFLLAENEALKRQLAGSPEAQRVVEPTVIVDKSKLKRNPKEEI